MTTGVSFKLKTVIVMITIKSKKTTKVIATTKTIIVSENAQ